MSGRTARRRARLTVSDGGMLRADALTPRPVNARDPARGMEEAGLYLCFRVGGERYLLDVRNVKEVTRVQRLTAVPGAREEIAGVIDLRGAFIPVVDVRRRMGGGPSTVDPRCSRIVVVAADGRLAGLLVDALHPVVRFRESQIQPPPPLTLPERAGCIAGLCAHAGEAFLLLDVERLLAPAAGPAPPAVFPEGNPS